MGIVESLFKFLESIFAGSSPDAKRRQELRAIETQLKNAKPLLFKNGAVQVNFAEAMHILYENTKTPHEILSNTIASGDAKQCWRYEEQLILTGLSKDLQETLDSLSFEKRKEEAKTSRFTEGQVFELQKQRLKNIIKEFNTPELTMIQAVIDRLHQLADLCKFNYISAIRQFDPSFIPDNPAYKPVFLAVPAGKIDSVLLDLYYLTENFEISSAMFDALVALETLHQHGSEMSSSEKQQLKSNLEKISAVFKQILRPDVLKDLIRLAKSDPNFEPQSASYKSSSLQKYASALEEQFIADESRIKFEIKDEFVTSEVQALFGEKSDHLEELKFYNAETNEKLQKNSPASLVWVLPLQLIKTFVNMFCTEGIRNLLNDIVIEGFFNNPEYKSEFSAAVYAFNDIIPRLQKFEANFEQGGHFSEDSMMGYIRDSHKDPEFIKQLVQVIQRVNKTAKEVIQDITSIIFEMYNHTSALLLDIKKPSPENISNLKVLMLSSRNRDHTLLLEKQHPQWRQFLEIMRNYAVVGELEKTHEEQ